MKLTRALFCLLLCAGTAPAAASSVHMVLKVDIPAKQAGRRQDI